MTTHNILRSVCDIIVEHKARGLKIKEIRLGNKQWEEFTELCDKRSIMGVRILHNLSHADLVSVVK